MDWFRLKAGIVPHICWNSHCVQYFKSSWVRCFVNSNFSQSLFLFHLSVILIQIFKVGSRVKNGKDPKMISQSSSKTPPQSLQKCNYVANESNCCEDNSTVCDNSPWSTQFIYVSLPSICWAAIPAKYLVIKYSHLYVTSS